MNDPKLPDPNLPELNPPGENLAPAPTPKPAHRWRWPRRMAWTALILIVLFAALLGGAFYWASSAAFENQVRLRIIALIEDATGGRVEIASFHWELLHLRAEATGLTIHGLEAASETPYAHVDRLRIGLGILGLTRELLFAGHTPRVILKDAVIDGPSFHLIVYKDGTTNQPQPRHPPKPGKPAMDTLFEAQIGQLNVNRGTVEIANHQSPFDLQAQDADLTLSWVPDAATAVNRTPTGPVSSQSALNYPGSYRIGFSMGNVDFAQGKRKPIPVQIAGSATLRHDAVQIDGLHIAALGRMLNIEASLTDFAHPAWQGAVQGQADLRLLAPTVAFEPTLTGIVSLEGSAHGAGDAFQFGGKLAVNGAHYADKIVDARTELLTANVHADQNQLLIQSIHTRLAQIGQPKGASVGTVDGDIELGNWLASTPKRAEQEALLRAHKTWPVPTGLIKAKLNGVSLDTILLFLAAPTYRHLGLDTVVSGETTTTFTGLGNDLSIGGELALVPSVVPVAGEAPVSGFVDATLHAEEGAIHVRSMDVRLPHSEIQGKGLLGVFPIDRASEMDLDIRSTDLSEFDSVLKTLNLQQGKRVGTAALPVTLKGQAEFHGQLNSSWLTPRVDGRLTADHIGIEIPDVAETDPEHSDAPLKFLNWDSLDVDGLYTPATIVIRHGILKRGAESLTLSGHLDAQNPAYKLTDTAPEYGPASALALSVTADQFPLSELLPLAGVAVPVDGKLSAKAQVSGKLSALTGTGTVDLAKIKAYGETFDHLHAEGSMSAAGGAQLLTLTNFALEQNSSKSSGRIAGNGSLDFASNQFQVDMRGSAIDLASLQQLKATGASITGKLGFTLLGGGKLGSAKDFDPQLQAKATLSGMTIAGGPVSDLQIAATTAKHAVTYDLSSHQVAGDFTAHGQTSFNADYYTQASLNFAKFDVGALLKLLKVTGITGQSALAGTAKISGPLARPEELRGEATLNEFAVAIEGVHLASKGAVHATLVQGIARLDPVEITGEDTDLKLNGSLALTGKQQLDLQASGSVNLRLAESLDTDLIASGVTSFQMEAHGPLTKPVLQGKVEFKNAALAMQDFPNGLSQIQGTLEFNQNRLEVRSLTAMSGGGQLSVSGYLGFLNGLYADLSATGKSIRIRYPQGISSLADANLRLQGPQNNLLLSGTVEVTRFQINSDLDLSGFASQSNSVPAIVAPDAPSNHLRLDVHLTSAPQLNFQNAYAKLAGDVDLHLRGTLATPSLMGRISLTEGSTSIGGTKYELQRGDIYFNNPVRIQPNIDLDATARVEDYDITLGLHGTPDKLNVTYRSEPPLPEADVIALLALGRTQDEQSKYSQQQQQAGDNPMTDALLGGALNATVSNRVQRLFGTGAIKVDPNFIGSIGNSTARVTVVEQIGKNLTFTYASNVNTTTQQLIQAEIAINRHVSLLVTQDESGIFSMVVKVRRQYR